MRKNKRQAKHTGHNSREVDESLSLNKKQLRDLLENSPIGIYRTTPDGRILLANPYLIQMLGYSSFGELASRNLEMEGFEPSYPRKKFKELIESQGEVKGLEAAWMRKDGTFVFVRENAKAIRDEKGAILYYEGTVEDITERKRAEEALRNSEAKYRGLVEKATVGISVSREGKIVWCNKAESTLFGYDDPSDLVGRVLTGLIHKDDLPELQKLSKRIRRGEALDSPVTFRAVRRDGRKVVVEAMAILLPFEGGDSILSFHTDVTERKQAEEELKESEKRYLSFAQNLDGIAYRGNVDFKPEFFHGAVEKITGYTEQDFMEGKIRWDSIIHNDDLPGYLEKVKERIRLKPRVAESEFRIVRKDGSIRWIHEAFQIIFGDSGEVIGSQGIQHDITERKQAEEAVKKSEEKYRSLFEGSLHPITIYDRDANIVMLNEVGAKNLKRPLREIIGKPLKEFIPETYQLTIERVRRVLETQTPLFVEDEISLPEGKRWFLSTLHPVLSPKGQSDLVQVISYDITERKRTEEVLQEERNKLLAIVDSMDYGLTIQDGDYNIIYQNEALKNLIGEHLGEKCYRAYEYGDKICDGCPVRMAWADRNSHTAERKIVMPSGKIMFWENTASPIRDAKGEMVGCLEIARNITERKRTEEEVSKLSQYLESVIDNANVWLDVLDEKANVTIWNKAAEQISGYAREEVVGYGKIWEWLYPDEAYRKGITAKAESIIKKGEIVEDFETIIRCKNGETKTISWNSRNLLDADGKPIGSIALGRDVTERKKLMQQLIQSEKLAAVGTLAYGIAHEFNNVLAGMTVAAEFGLSQSDNQEVRECFQAIAENSQRGSSITNSLLAVAGEKREKKELTNVTQPLENVLSFSRRELEKANIKIIQDFKPVPQIFCDSGELSEVFLNMINNARDAMTPHGGILIVKLRPYKDNIQIVLKDTGMGIPEEIKDKIFDPFVTTKGALGKSEIPGTGLGLFVTYGIINSYHGKIDVDSKVGKGTTFTILIPVSKNLPPESALKKKAEFPEEIKRRLNILLVDDEEVICSTLKRFLESKGHRVATSLKAEEGFKLFKKDKFDVVLSDITMPGMDGIELIREMKEKDKNSKIIAITGHVRQQKLEEAKNAGAEEVLIKPFRNTALYETINRLLSEKRKGEEKEI